MATKAQETTKQTKIWVSKFMSSPEASIMKNDLVHTWKAKGTLSLTVLIPLLLILVVPATFIVAISLIDIQPGAVFPQRLMELLPKVDESMTYKQMMSYAFSKLLCPMLFLAVPIITSITAACQSFISQRDEGVLETLFLAPISTRKLFSMKIAACMSFSTFVSVISILVLIVVMTFGSFVTDAPYFFDLTWFIYILLTGPALSMFCILFLCLASRRIESLSEGLNTIGYFLLPIVVVALFQFGGVFYFSFIWVFALTLLLIIVDIVLFNIVGRSFTPENLLTGVFLEKRKIKSA